MDPLDVTLVAAVGARDVDDGTSVEDVIGAVQGAARLVQSAMGIELGWSLSAFVRSDDLESSTGSATAADGLDWDFVRRRLGSGRPTSIVVDAVSAIMKADFDRDPDPARIDHHMYVARIEARFPCDLGDDAPPVGGLGVRTAMSRWAVYGGGERLDWLVPALVGWVTETCSAIDGDTGYVAVDEQYLSGDRSAWERQNRLTQGHRDFERWLWGYGWGTLLGPAQLTAIGGASRLREVSDRVQGLPGGRVWVDLGAEPVAVPDDVVRRLVDVLEPALNRPEWWHERERLS